MDARIGNEYARKFKTPEQRTQLCADWCAHLRNGFTKESFPQCDPQTFKRYMKEFPDDFDVYAIAAAEREQKMRWEERIQKCADTGIGSASAIIFGLKNISNWRDKNEISMDPKNPLVITKEKAAGMTDEEAERIYTDAVRNITE